MGALVNNSDAKRNVQALLEIHKENNPREQSCYRHRSTDRGSRNQVPGGWEFVGDYGDYGDDNFGDDSSQLNFEVCPDWRQDIK